MLFSAVDSWLERVSAGQIRRPQPGEKECMQCRVLGTRCTRYGVKSEFGAKVKPCEASIKSHKFAHSETSSVTVIIIKHFRGPRILTDTPIYIYIYNMIYKHIYIYRHCWHLISRCGGCVPGTCVFGAAGLHSAMEAVRASTRSTNRYFFGLVATAFLTAATWRAVTPTVPVH
jgi:hypothetical protein